MKNFKQLRSYLNKIPYISYGGCGYATLFMYQWLKVYKPKVKVKIVFAYSWLSDAYETNEAYFKGIHTSISSCSHAFLQIENKYVDCKGVVDISHYAKYHCIEDPKFVLKALKNKNVWNCTFDREWVPKMETAIGIKLTDL